MRRELRHVRPLPSRAIREALLQLVLFAGYPRAINALFAAADTLGFAAGERADGGTVAARRRRGVRLCRRIYGGSFETLMRNMNDLHPALAEGIVEEGYGRVLSRPGLTSRERELILVPVLAALGAWRQLPGHARGALRVGATKKEVSRVLVGVRDLLGSRVDRALRYID